MCLVLAACGTDSVLFIDLSLSDRCQRFMLHALYLVSQFSAFLLSFSLYYRWVHAHLNYASSCLITSFFFKGEMISLPPTSWVIPLPLIAENPYSTVSHRQSPLCHVRGAEDAMAGSLCLYRRRVVKHTQKLSCCIRDGWEGCKETGSRRCSVARPSNDRVCFCNVTALLTQKRSRARFAENLPLASMMTSLDVSEKSRKLQIK